MKEKFKDLLESAIATISIFLLITLALIKEANQERVKRTDFNKTKSELSEKRHKNNVE